MAVSHSVMIPSNLELYQLTTAHQDIDWLEAKIVPVRLMESGVDLHLLVNVRSLLSV